MTGLYVKSALLKSLESLIERSPNTVVSLMLFDIDRFKSINDTMGHQIGDKCIKAVASLAQGAFRKEDLLGRYGGDEFIVVLPVLCR
jgi:diguanylate cyclase (GGDEF)-like protein